MSWVLCQILGLIPFNLQNYFHSTNEKPEVVKSEGNWLKNEQESETEQELL